MARQYSKAASAKVEQALAEQKRGQLKSGGVGKTDESRKQAIVIALSEARREGGKVPTQPAARGKTVKKKARQARSSRARMSSELRIAIF